MRVRSGLYRSPHFSNDQSTPHSAALHTGLRSGHTSGVQDVNLFPSWMTLSFKIKWTSPAQARIPPKAFVHIISYQGQSFRIDIFKLADQKINPKGLTPIVH